MLIEECTKNIDETKLINITITENNNETKLVNITITENNNEIKLVNTTITKVKIVIVILAKCILY